VARAIVDTAADVNADMIVMSSESLTGFARGILGSVADAVVRTAPCPVLVMPRPDGLLSHGAEPES
jgi:nucleotide-binding universal stress UspA family protein